MLDFFSFISQVKRLKLSEFSLALVEEEAVFAVSKKSKVNFGLGSRISSMSFSSGQLSFLLVDPTTAIKLQGPNTYNKYYARSKLRYSYSAVHHTLAI